MPNYPFTNSLITLFIILGLLPSFAWLIFFLKEDIHPEPKKIIALVFLMGALITALAIFLEITSQNLLKNFGVNQYHIISFLVLAAIEEITKFLAAFIVLSKWKKRFLDEPVDAMIYMITAALGFAAAENIFVVLSNSFNGNGVGEIAGIMTLRFIGATLLHALSSGVVGYYWAKKINCQLSNLPAQAGVRCRMLIIKGLIIASLLHTLFNYFILKFNEILIYPTIFLIIIAFFIFWDFEKLKKAP